MALLFVSFIAGVLTTLAPCILPLLPVIIGGSISDGNKKHRPIVIIGSLVVSIVLFTLLLKYSSALLSVSQMFWSILSGVILILVSLTYIFPDLWSRLPFVNKLNLKSNEALAKGFGKENVKGDIIIGAALGPVFSSCSPTYFVILATILPRSLAEGILHLVAYALGLGLTLLVISLLGQRVVDKLGWAANPSGWFKKIIGIIFLLVGIFVMTGLDKKVQTSLLESGFFDITKVETRIRQEIEGVETKKEEVEAVEETKKMEEVKISETQNTEKVSFLSTAEKEKKFDRYQEIVKPAGYVNTGGKPITLEEYVGKKIILLDVMTYSCINCQRTFPYVISWYEKYKDDGFIVVGIHTPEFSFEKVQKNVEKAMAELGIKFPVVLDNDYATWNAYNNRYWPRKYLIDIDGYVVYDHIGEGAYSETEKAIQDALAERAYKMGDVVMKNQPIENQTSVVAGVNSPETYFGSSRNSLLGNGTQGQSGTQVFELPNFPRVNTLYLGGTWNINGEYAEAGQGAQILYKYSSNDIYFVASSPNTPAKIKVYRDGEPVGSYAGADVDPKTSEAVVSGDRLYKLVHDEKSGTHTLKIEIESGTLGAYTFTFG